MQRNQDTVINMQVQSALLLAYDWTWYYLIMNPNTDLIHEQHSPNLLAEIKQY